MTALPASVPHEGAAELGRWTVDSYHGLRHLRTALRQAVEELGGAGNGLPRLAGGADLPVGGAGSLDEDDVAERIAVVATELATNALRHGRPPVEVRLSRVGDLLVVDASDHDLDGEPQFDVERPLGQGGLGLLLARTFAIEVGWYRDSAAKHVWASFPA
ncbi:ATP-binding protein [Actinoplanes sp. NPDC023936]|uniref:ATP-binding protein n=1 Tax=Actinoplanes sp. NPDC023936 TaxID=3154910 RepID=UPI0033EF5FB6